MFNSLRIRAKGTWKQRCALSVSILEVVLGIVHWQVLLWNHPALDHFLLWRPGLEQSLKAEKWVFNPEWHVDGVNVHICFVISVHVDAETVPSVLLKYVCSFKSLKLDFFDKIQQLQLLNKSCNFFFKLMYCKFKTLY